MLSFLDKMYVEVPTDDSADFGEQLFLYSLIRATKPKVIVETGTHKGLTTLFMAHALYDGQIDGHVHTCDPFPWDQLGNFRKFPELEKFITFYPIRGDAMEVQNIDLLFIDGFHEKEEVLSEWNNFKDKLSDEAVVIFHDCGYPHGLTCDPNGALKELGLTTIWLPTKNSLRIYAKGHQEYQE